MKVKEAIEFFSKAQKHYDVSDEFVMSGYQQSAESDGYIKRALQSNLEVDFTKAEPNQKWHLLDNYIKPSLEGFKMKKPMTLDDEFSIYYAKLQCPEMLLWIAEAAGVDKEIVQTASDEAKAVIDSGDYPRPRTSACKKIREIIPFSKIEESLN